MAEKRSEASKWPSRYSPGGWVTAAQYIIELVCERQARNKKKADLPVRFWNLPEWQKEFVSQTRATHRLLKKYEPQAIISAVKQRNIWSLRPKWVEAVIQQEQKKLDGKRLAQKAETSTKPKREDQATIVDTGRRKSRPTKRASLLALDEEEHGEEEKGRD
jgi:hypothetical protein